MSILVGLDVGTTGVKALTVSPEGDVLAQIEEAYPFSTPQPGWAEQDPEDWWRAAKSALGKLAVGNLAGIGLAGQMHGLVVLDERERVLRPAILWNDQRTGAECAEIEERLGLRRLVQLTGNRALPGFTAPKLHWLRRHEPEVYERIAHVMLPKDYVRLRLTGERAIDATDASGTLLFDVAGRRWSDEVLAALEIPPEWLPRVVESPVMAGHTSDGVPVAAGAGDQAAGALGVGVDRPGPFSVVLGTSGVVFAALEDFAADPEGRLHSFCHAVPGAWHAMGVMLSAAGSLRWFRDAALSLRHDRGALVRAVLEGVAYGLRDSLELLQELGVEPQVGRVSGGGARSDLWVRIVASVLELPLERAVVEEGAAYGAALLGGVAAGVFADVHEAVGTCVRVRDRIEPEPGWAETYASGYKRFRALYPALRPLEET